MRECERVSECSNKLLSDTRECYIIMVYLAHIDSSGLCRSLARSPLGLPDHIFTSPSAFCNNTMLVYQLYTCVPVVLTYGLSSLDIVSLTHHLVLLMMVASL